MKAIEMEFDEQATEVERLEAERQHLDAELKKLGDAMSKPLTFPEYAAYPGNFLEAFHLPPEEAAQVQELVNRHRILEKRQFEAKRKLEALGIRRAFARTQRSELFSACGRYFFLVLGCCVLAVLAYIFKSNALASIPLIGIVVLIVLWPVFEKFRLLEKISAEFRPSGVNIVAAATNTDEYLRMQGELVKRELELKIARTERQIHDIRYKSPGAGEVP